MSAAVALAALCVVLAALGHWGYRRAEQLVPTVFGPEERARRVRVLRRGAVASYVVAVAFAVFAIASLI